MEPARPKEPESPVPRVRMSTRLGLEEEQVTPAKDEQGSGEEKSQLGKNFEDEEGIQALGIKHSEGYRVRLKLLCLVGCSKLRLFSFLSNRLWKEREGWKEKLLSKREEVRKFSS